MQRAALQGQALAQRYGITAKGLLRLKENGKQKYRDQHFRTPGDLLTPSHFLPQTCYKGLSWSTAFARHKKKVYGHLLNPSK